MYNLKLQFFNSIFLANSLKLKTKLFHKRQIMKKFHGMNVLGLSLFGLLFFSQFGTAQRLNQRESSFQRIRIESSNSSICKTCSKLVKDGERGGEEYIEMGCEFLHCVGASLPENDDDEGPSIENDNVNGGGAGPIVVNGTKNNEPQLLELMKRIKFLLTSNNIEGISNDIRVELAIFDKNGERVFANEKVVFDAYYTVKNQLSRIEKNTPMIHFEKEETTVYTFMPIFVESAAVGKGKIQAQLFSFNRETKQWDLFKTMSRELTIQASKKARLKDKSILKIKPQNNRLKLKQDLKPKVINQKSLNQKLPKKNKED